MCGPSELLKHSGQKQENEMKWNPGLKEIAIEMCEQVQFGWWQETRGEH